MHDNGNCGNLPYFGVNGNFDFGSDEDIECDDELAVATVSYSIESNLNEDDKTSFHSMEYDNLTDEVFFTYDDYALNGCCMFSRCFWFSFIYLYFVKRIADFKQR